MTRYVLGFAIIPSRDEEVGSNSVVLVCKQKGPTLNIGKWNGIGGKIENNEIAVDAMRREWDEEIGSFRYIHWHEFGEIIGKHYHVTLFTTCLDGFVWIPDKNDIGEIVKPFPVSEVVVGPFGSRFAWNVPAMLQFICERDRKSYLCLRENSDND